jgi:hypothetical protein
MPVLQRLTEAIDADGYLGPQIHFLFKKIQTVFQDIQQSNRPFRPSVLKQGLMMRGLLQGVIPNYKRITTQSSKERSLLSWLSRLCYMKDTQNGLSKVILCYLDLAESADDFREHFFAIIRDSCHLR